MELAWALAGSWASVSPPDRTKRSHLMHPASTTSLSRTQESAIDVLLTLAHICLNGAGRLMALNSTVDKEALFDGATMARALAGVTTTAALHEIQGDLAGPML
jgi:hypothetical protein